MSNLFECICAQEGSATLRARPAVACMLIKARHSSLVSLISSISEAFLDNDEALVSVLIQLEELDELIGMVAPPPQLPGCAATRDLVDASSIAGPASQAAFFAFLDSAKIKWLRSAFGTGTRVMFHCDSNQIRIAHRHQCWLETHGKLLLAIVWESTDH